MLKTSSAETENINNESELQGTEQNGQYTIRKKRKIIGISNLEVVSLFPVQPSSLVLVSSAPPCNSRVSLCKLSSCSLFLLKPLRGFLLFENHGLQDLRFLACSAYISALVVAKSGL